MFAPTLTPKQAERFWSRVDRGPNCWIWTGSKFSGGYGRTYLKSRSEGAHRVAFALTRGPIAPGMYVCHRCDNPPCCNPAHLFLGSHTDNMADMAAKGRRVTISRGWAGARRGEGNPFAKLTTQSVRAIRAAAASGIPTATLAKQFGVSTRHVRGVVSGRDWSHV